jgi:hypothetical protein
MLNFDLTQALTAKSSPQMLLANMDVHTSVGRVPASAFFFLSPNLWSRWVDNHAQEELAKFGWRTKKFLGRWGHRKK